MGDVTLVTPGSPFHTVIGSLIDINDASLFSPSAATREKRRIISEK